MHAQRDTQKFSLAISILVATLVDARIVGLTVNLFDVLAHARWRVRREETLTG